MGKRWRTAAIVVAIAGALSAGWGAAGVFQSPSQVAAQTVPPPPKAVTAAVTRGQLARTVSLKARVEHENHFTATLQAGLDQREVITRLPLAIGQELNETSVVAEVNGRPRFALTGSFPFYRSLTLGDSGPDVKQLQLALAGAGYRVNTDGYLGVQTASVLKLVYSQAGYAMPEESPPSKAQPPAAATATEDTPLRNQSQSAVVAIPAHEFLVFPTLPAFLETVPALGSVLVDASSIAISAGPIVAGGEIDAATALNLKSGMTATVQGPDGAPIAGTVDTLMEMPPIDDAGADASRDAAAGKNRSWTIDLVFSEPPPATWLGQEVVSIVTIAVVATDSLIVPTIAVVSGGDENGRVLKQTPDGRFASVAVNEAGVLAGRSAVVPVDEGSLRVGDLVKVG